jgi:mono/diheme cytochrome c family protein
MNVSANCCFRFRRATSGLACLALLTIAGCRSEVDEPLAVFEPNLVHITKYAIQKGISMDQAAQDATWVVSEMFGTPDEPKIPAVVAEDEELSSVVSIDQLLAASGPANAEGRGLYRKHCSICHGVSGDGRGPTAAVQVPYPRDYRLGIFKFKSTPRGAKPTRDDLARVIRDGIAGTSMIPIPGLTEQNIEALVDYVIYLSWRGELERRIIDDAIYELDLEGGDRILNTELATRLATNPGLKDELAAAAKLPDNQLGEEYEQYLESWEIIQDFAAEIAESWLDAADQVVEVPAPPPEIPVAESYGDVVKFRGGEQAAAFEASVKRGQELFVGKIAACSKCHGETGLGNGQTTDYDDWTKDWTSRVGLDPTDQNVLVPLLARGAFTPKNALPRNFAEGAFRGGSSSEQLFRRITQGIDGTPMPAVTFVDGEFEQQDVWHLINFIRSLQTNVDESTAP